jgi:hypothetical protein
MSPEEVRQQPAITIKISLIDWKCVSRWIGLLVAAAIVVHVLDNYFDIGTDDSDLDGWHRSGFTILTDHKTGLQYLSDGHGGLVLRGRTP